MIALDCFDKKLRIFDTLAKIYLNRSELGEYKELTATEIETKLKRLLESPITDFSVVNKIYFRSKWGDLLHRIYKQASFTLLEIASGDEDMIPQAIAHSYPGSKYITVNMNERLNERLLKKTEDLDIKLELIKADANTL